MSEKGRDWWLADVDMGEWCWGRDGARTYWRAGGGCMLKEGTNANHLYDK